MSPRQRIKQSLLQSPKTAFEIAEETWLSLPETVNTLQDMSDAHQASFDESSALWRVVSQSGRHRGEGL